MLASFPRPALILGVVETLVVESANAVVFGANIKMAVNRHTIACVKRFVKVLTDLRKGFAGRQKVIAVKC